MTIPLKQIEATELGIGINSDARFELSSQQSRFDPGMRLSASIDLLMHLATQEAIAGEFKEIEPEHLLEGMLKLSELPVQDLDRIAPRGDVAKELAAEVALVRTELQRRSIDSTQTRRRLREDLGKGNIPYEAGRLHRSGRTRAVFEAAAKMAEEAGEETLSVRHLLEATLASPTSAMLKALGSAAVSMPRSRVDSPILNEYGMELRLLAIHPDVLYGHKAESMALAQALSLKNRRCVLIVSDRDNLVREIVHATSFSEKLDSMKVFDVTGLMPCGKDAPDAIEKLTKLIDEVATLPGTILFLPGIDLSKDNDKGKDWADLLKAALAKRSTQCICRLGQSAYQECVSKDREWKRLAHIMWVQEGGSSAIPLEL